MRIGVSLADRSTPDAVARLETDIRRAADDGFASAWLDNIFGMDALTALAAAGRSVPGIELGTAVIPTYPRHPAALAQQALTTAAVLDGRLVLGIGLSHRIVIEDMYGYDMGQPIRHMREYLSVLVPLLGQQPVSFAGTTVRADIALTVPAPGRVPLLLAALGPQMLRLAGQHADGTVLWMTGPATVRDHVAPTITAAAATAGRDAPRVVCILPVYVTDEEGPARERATRIFGGYGDLPSYRAMLDREGASGPADVALVGDEDTVRGQVRLLEEAGVTDFVAAEFAPGDDRARTRAFLRSLLG
ncbi:MAG TPA: TIGR03564 family F420-dependent LLM class oxidoreductase [Streptosporangiaceae bacterium]|nr:TIGR03564 family F420-dependent LLM class oxidoreductase [Streptosporangiaceae bacterium]